MSNKKNVQLLQKHLPSVFQFSILFRQARWPFSNFPNLLNLQEKSKTPSIKNCYKNDCATGNFTDVGGETMKASIKHELTNCKYFSGLSDGSKNTSMIEEKLVYLLYLKDGKPTVNF